VANDERNDMKMAKASEADTQMAMDLVNALDLLGQRWAPCMPEAIEKLGDDDESERFDRHDDEQCGRAMRHLLELTDRASLGRVIWGAVVMLDPRNKLIDPDADTIEHHPDRKDSARFRWLVEDHADPDTRARCREILERLPVMGYGAAVQLIDDAMTARGAVGAA
jgi:hypothetical protein